MCIQNIDVIQYRYSQSDRMWQCSTNSKRERRTNLQRIAMQAYNQAFSIVGMEFIGKKKTFGVVYVILVMQQSQSEKRGQAHSIQMRARQNKCGNAFERKLSCAFFRWYWCCFWYIFFVRSGCHSYVYRVQSNFCIPRFDFCM